MAHMLIRHRVADFDKWHAEYLDHGPVRIAAGLTDLHLWRNLENPEEVYILFGISDMENAKAFVASEDLKEKMQSAGVLEVPDIVFLDET